MRHAVVLGLVSLAAFCFAPALAHAEGPCTQDIAQLRKQLASMPGLGAPVSEPGAGLTVGQRTAQNGRAGQSNPNSTTGGNVQHAGQQASLAHGGSPGTVGGTAGAIGAAVGPDTKSGIESGRIATSSEDVRRQSVGKPTMAEQAAHQAETGRNTASTSGADTSSADRVSQAKGALQRAVDLNARNDAACKGAIQDARKLIPQGHG